MVVYLKSALFQPFYLLWLLKKLPNCGHPGVALEFGVLHPEELLVLTVASGGLPAGLGIVLLAFLQTLCFFVAWRSLLLIAVVGSALSFASSETSALFLV